MKKITDKYVNEVVKSYASKFFLEKKGFVLAGGFGTALYSFYLLSEGEKQNFVKFLKLGLYGLSSLEAFKQSVGDIDYWVLDGSPAAKFTEEWFERDSQDKIKYIQKDDEDIRKAFFAHDLNFSKATRFSLSFVGNAYGTGKQQIKEQIVRLRTYKDVPDIFKDYDLNLCKVGWYNGELYVSSEAESAFAFRSIETCKPLQDYDNSFQRVWSSLRLIKYYKRYGFEPDIAATNELHNMFIESVDFLNSNAEEQNEQSLTATLGPGFAFHPVQAVPQPVPKYGSVPNWNAIPAKVEDPYDSYKLRTISQMRKYYTQLLGEIPYLLSLDNYSITMATFLIDAPAPYDKNIKSYIEFNGELKSQIVFDDSLSIFDQLI